MVRQVDAIFSQGAFRPIGPITMPEGTRVHLSFEEGTELDAAPSGAKIRTPKLARSSDVADFVLEVRDTDEPGV